MRVGFDARWYNESGVGTYIKGLLTAISEFGDEVEIIVYEDSRNRLPACGPHIRPVSVSSQRFSVSEQFEFRALCKSDRIDVFHSPFQYGAQLFLPCPLVLTIHDLIPFCFRTRSWPKQLTAVPIVKLGYRAAVHRSDHIIAVSANTALDAQRILRVPSTRITPIPLAASQQFHPWSAPRETEYLSIKYGVRTPYVVSASTGNWRTKNLETALRALALSSKLSAIAFQTIIYGTEKGLNAVRERHLISALNIRRAGYVPVEDLGALFRNASLFINASLYEGFGLPVLEAMSCGCPVVTSSGGSLAEVAAGGAQIFDPLDANGMAKAVTTLLCDVAERERWRSRALARAAEFSWRKTAEQTLAVYQQVCRSPHLTHDLAFTHDATSPRC